MNVIITGGTRGIGKACVEYFTKNGHNVAFIYKSNEECAKTLSESTGAIGFRADISNFDDATNAINLAIKALGGVDVLVNNAGISQIKMLCDITYDDWQTMINTNLSSAFYTSKAAIPFMISKKKGRIINIGSMWGKVGASCEVHYSASKAGLRGFTTALAKELGPSGITVNLVEPGVIRTDMNANLDEITLSELCDETPLCKIGEPVDVAATVYFLASDEAGFITGQAIGVDGGFAV